jgi:hypothetical protein
MNSALNARAIRLCLTVGVSRGPEGHQSLHNLNAGDFCALTEVKPWPCAARIGAPLAARGAHGRPRRSRRGRYDRLGPPARSSGGLSLLATFAPRTISAELQGKATKLILVNVEVRLLALGAIANIDWRVHEGGCECHRLRYRDECWCTRSGVGRAVTYERNAGSALRGSHQLGKTPPQPLPAFSVFR